MRTSTTTKEVMHEKRDDRLISFERLRTITRRESLLRRLFGRLLGRDFSVTRCGLFQVGFHVRVDVANRPADPSAEQFQEKLILPIVRAVADGGVEDASLAIHARPSGRIRRALVGRSR